jgi:hypothetical protein
MPEYEAKLVEKINREFSKKATGYRFSFAEMQSSKWGQSFTKLLGSVPHLESNGSKN